MPHHCRPMALQVGGENKMSPHPSGRRRKDDGPKSVAKAPHAPPTIATTGHAGDWQPCTWEEIVDHPQWMDVLRHATQYLSADDIKTLRLTGNKEMNLTDPSLTSHLHLRMDRAPFFSSCKSMALEDTSEDRLKKWLGNRRGLIVKDADASIICPKRVGYLAANGYLDSVTHLSVLDCHAHERIISTLARLPNIESLTLIDNTSSDQAHLLDALESILSRVQGVPYLKKLSLDFDCTVHGSRLSFLRNLHGLEDLRLRGFDLSDGLSFLEELTSLHALHLCHGNFYNPSNEVDEKNMLFLTGLVNLRNVHLEGFNCLSEVGLRPLCALPTHVNSLVLKHCQELSEDCLTSVKQLTSLTSLHMVHSEYDDAPTFDSKRLKELNALASLKTLSLFYVLENLSDLYVLSGMPSLETLNVAVEDEVALEDLSNICQSIIIPAFASLRKLRVFTEDCDRQNCFIGQLEITCDTFNFGDAVCLD